MFVHPYEDLSKLHTSSMRKIHQYDPNMRVRVLDSKGNEVIDWYKTLRGNWLMDRHIKMQIDPKKAMG